MGLKEYIINSEDNFPKINEQNPELDLKIKAGLFDLRTAGLSPSDEQIFTLSGGNVNFDKDKGIVKEVIAIFDNFGKVLWMKPEQKFFCQEISEKMKNLEIKNKPSNLKSQHLIMNKILKGSQMEMCLETSLEDLRILPDSIEKNTIKGKEVYTFKLKKKITSKLNTKLSFLAGTLFLIATILLWYKMFRIVGLANTLFLIGILTIATVIGFLFFGWATRIKMCEKDRSEYFEAWFRPVEDLVFIWFMHLFFFWIPFIVTNQTKGFFWENSIMLTAYLAASLLGYFLNCKYSMLKMDYNIKKL